MSVLTNLIQFASLRISLSQILRNLSSFVIFGPYIVFTFTGSVRNVRNDVNIYIYIYIYIYICQQHGGLLGGSRSRWYYSVNFVSLLLFSSTKNLQDLKIWIES